MALVIEHKRHDEQVLEVLEWDGHAFVLSTDHTGCPNNGDRCYYRGVYLTKVYPIEEEVRAWHRIRGYKGLVSDGECPGCNRAYRMYLSQALIVQMRLAQ